MSEGLNFLKEEFVFPDGTWGQGQEEQSLGFGYIYFGLCRTLKPKTVVCLGSQKGFAPGIFAQALKANKNNGKLYFIDAGFDEKKDGPKAWAGQGHWRQYGDQVFRDMGLSNVEVLVQTTQEVVWEEPIDILYINADHSYEGVKHDFEKFSPFSSFVLLHDSLYEDNGVAVDYHGNTRDVSHWKDHDWGVRRFLKELNRPQFEIPMFAGLTLIDNRKFCLEELK